MDKIKKILGTSINTAILELTKCGLLVINEAGGICEANTIVLRDLAYEEEEIKAKMIFEINPHVSLLEWKKIWNRLISEKEIKDVSELMTASGVLFPVKTGLHFFESQGQQYCLYIIKNLLETSRHKDLLELTAELANIGSWEYDLVSKRFFLSQEAMTIFGMEKKERRFLPTAFFYWLRNNVKNAAIKRIIKKSRLAIDQGLPFEIDVRQKGKARTFQIQGVPQVSEGITAKLFGTIQGIRAQDEEKSISHFILENAIEMIAWGGKNGLLMQVNQALCQQSGYNKSELSEMKITDLFLNFNEVEWAQKWQQLKKKQSIELEGVIKTKSGEIYPVYLLLKYVQYHEESFFVAFMRSLTVKKQREELLELMYHTLSQSNDMICWLAEDSSIIYVNDTICEKLGYTREELDAIQLAHILPDYQGHSFWKRLIREKYLENEAMINTKEGQQIAVEFIQTYLEFKNQKIACITFRDISARRLKEKELEKAAQQIGLLKEKLQEEKTYLREELSDKFNFDNIISRSPNYRNVLQQVARVASTDATVLLLGETGTGKELLARAIHNLSEREDGPMVKVNCAALPEHLIESEIFGHEKGAFTGAYKRKIGRFELADQGTIFLDEIGEVPLELQAKLLRILQEGTFERLGSNETIKVNVRVIAATNRKLEQLVEEGKFRQDLYYRLNVFPIYNLPLRERTDDIPLLVQFFVKKNCQKAGRPLLKIPQPAVDRLISYPFPGNVRELENIIERAVILSRGEVLNLHTVISNLSKSKKRSKKEFLSFEDMQRKHILKALERTNWKVTGSGSAAELLKLNGKTLASKMRKLDLKRTYYQKKWTEQF